MNPKTCRTTEKEIKVIAVQWKSRAAGFVSSIEGSTVESMAQKACSHFRLGPVDKEYTLMTEVEGVALELTNDLLQHLKSGTVVRLQEASDEDCYSHNDRAAAVPSFSSAVDLNAPALASGSLPVDNSPQPSQYEGNGQRNHKALQFVKSTPANEDFRIFVTNSREKTWMVKAESSDTIGDIKQKLQDKTGLPFARQSLSYGGEQLEDGRTLSAYNIQNKARIQLGGEFGTVIRGGGWPRTRGGGVRGSRGPRRGRGKPVIYLFPRTHLPHATVTVTLTPDWSFSHVYPIVDAKVLDDGKQAITWSVSADEDGTLVEKETMRELSYLFWEAHPNPAAAAAPPPSLPSAPPLATERNGFPTHASDSDSSSLEPDTPTTVMLPFTALLPYLDRVLRTLSLHTSARNDFITYWLPALSQAPFVALRFLPQAAFARDVGLRVEPTPDVVTRVFMLFRAVPAEDAETETWAAARARGEADEVDWVRVVGVGPDAFRPALFRVLEWGGMEVL